ncbi:MAG: MBOAT family protein [Lachnospiraceae bacterium]|nr:MBOAT family protein [Lachnospiraceae bacterium]
MLFSSLTFLLIFLPITVILGNLLPKKIQNTFLLLASLFFYAWGEPVYVLLMLVSIALNWSFGFLMDKFEKAKTLILIFDVLANVGILGYYKYFNFVMELAGNVLKRDFGVKEIALPIGISFFTFQSLSYAIDLYRGRYKAQKNIINLALYISFFPQLIAGPIVKYINIENQLQNRILVKEKMAAGIKRFCYGLGKKVIIANTLASIVDQVYGFPDERLTSWLVWIASIMYTLQIYYDFSGYSDMAIGLGRMFGFEFDENFRLPYTAYSIQDFWRKWHISLGTWFREYVYIPLGGNRKGTARTFVNLLIVFLLTGIWHGAGINFIVWGLIYGVLSVIERAGLSKILEKYKFLGRIYTLVIVNFCWVLFRADTMERAICFLKMMVRPLKYLFAAGSILDQKIFLHQFITNKVIAIAILAVIGCGPIQYLVGKTKLAVFWKDSYIETVYCLLMLFLSLALLASNTYNPFIYFRF